MRGGIGRMRSGELENASELAATRGLLRAYNHFVLRKFLAGLAIASFTLALIVLLFWWRSYRYIDHINLRSLTGQRAELTSSHGMLMVTRTQNLGSMVTQRSTFYPMRQVLGGCLVVPAFWAAATIRRMLPRPPGTRGRMGRGRLASGRNGERGKTPS